jgi:hypothetical protein
VGGTPQCEPAESPGIPFKFATADINNPEEIFKKSREHLKIATAGTISSQS